MFGFCSHVRRARSVVRAAGCSMSIAGFLILTAPDGAAARVPALVASVEQATPYSMALPESLSEVDLAGLRLSFAEGDLLPLVADGRVIGLYFEGNGELRYRPSDPNEAAQLTLNVKRVTRLAAAEGTLTAKMTEAIVLDPRLAQHLPLPPYAERASAEVVRQVEAMQKRFARDRGVAASHRVVQGLLEEPTPAVAVAMIRAGRDDLVYTLDGLRNDETRLVTLKRFDTGSPLAGARYAQLLSRQRLTAGHDAARPKRYVIRHVDVDLTHPRDDVLDLTVTETVEIMAPARTLGFTLWSERSMREGTRPYRLEHVELADGTPLPFSHRLGDVIVELPAIAQPGTEVDLRFHIGGDALFRPANHSFWWLPIGEWLPLPGRWDQAAFTYRAVLRVAPPYTPFSMGKTVRRWEEDGLLCAEFTLDRPVQFAVAMAGKYHSSSFERDGQTMNVSSYAFKQKGPKEKIANNVFELIRFYETLLGPFPFDHLEIIEINSFGFGVAPPGVIYLTREAFDPSPRGRIFRRELNMRMAHEVAHMWWGHVAQMSSPEEQWLSESTAEYYAAVAVGHLIGEHKFRDAMRAWQEQAADAKGVGSIYRANQLVGERAFRERFGLLYARGPLMLHDLRERLGDETFFTVMKSYLTNFRFQHIRTEKLIELTNYITKEDHTDWFRQQLFTIQ